MRAIRIMGRRARRPARVATACLMIAGMMVTGGCAVPSLFDHARATASGAVVAGPGSIVAIDHLSDSDARQPVPGGHGALVHYRSTDAHTGMSRTVSGMVFVPPGVAPRGGWPVLAFASASPGTETACPAPTAPAVEPEPTVVQYLSHGYAVAVSTGSAASAMPGVPDSATAGLALIDSVRALRRAYPNVSTHWAAMGVAQGGAGVWGADTLAHRYAPDLQLLGAVALSPTADMTGLVSRAQRGTLSNDQARLVQQTQIAHGRHPLDLDTRRTDDVDQNRAAQSTCGGASRPLIADVARMSGPLDVVEPTTAAVEPLRASLAAAAVSAGPLSAPLSVVYGTDDTVVDPAWTTDVLRRECAAGGTLTWQLESGTGRTDTDHTRQIDWVTDRFGGRPAQSSCQTTSVDAEGAGAVVAAAPVPTVASALPPGSHAARVLYRSTEGDTGLPTVVSGTVFSPAGTPPPGGWPVIAYGHGTTGIDTDCGLSGSPTLQGQAALVSSFLSFGYAVSLPDYQGLGGPGPHPYLDARTAGLNVIDSVRALRATFPDISTRWGALGHSQGGAAVWSADEQAGTYAPELAFVGAVALAPAASVTGIVDKSDRRTLSTDQIPAFALIVTSLQRLHPELDLDEYRHGVAAEHWSAIAACAGPLLGERAAALARIRSADVAPDTAVASDRVHRLLARWALPQRPASAPMSVLYGAADQLVDAGWTTNALHRACAMGDTIEFDEQAGGTHSDLDLTGQLPWLRDRFAGQPAPDNCR